MRGLWAGILASLVLAAPAHALTLGKVTVNLPVAGAACTVTAVSDPETLLDLVVDKYALLRFEKTACGNEIAFCQSDRERGFPTFRDSRGCALTTDQLQAACAEERTLPPGFEPEVSGCSFSGGGVVLGCREETSSDNFFPGFRRVRECAAATPGLPLNVMLACEDRDRSGVTLEDVKECRTGALAFHCEGSDSAFLPETRGHCTVTGVTAEPMTYCTSPILLEAFLPVAGTLDVVAVPTRLEPAPPEGC